MSGIRRLHLPRLGASGGRATPTPRAGDASCPRHRRDGVRGDSAVPRYALTAATADRLRAASAAGGSISGMTSHPTTDPADEIVGNLPSVGLGLAPSLPALGAD